MTSITNSYYQLSNLFSGSSGNTSASSGATTGIASLADALNAAGQSSSTGSDASAYLLNLSPAAQNLLNSDTSTSSGASNDSFQLTSEEQTKLNAILAKYKDAPFTQATFDSIQKDLQAAGLSPQTLSTKDQIASFNPTTVLLQALNGTASDPAQAASTSAQTEQTKQNNYLQQVVSLWKSVSTTATSY